MNGTTRVRHRLLMALVITVAAAGLSTAPASSYGGFSDVPSGSYYAEAVAWAADTGITTGTSSGCFSPSATATRGQVATFLYRFAGEPNPGSEHPFSDVHAQYQRDSVSWLHNSGITTGTSSSTFSPDDPITRADFATMLHRFDGNTRHYSSPFKDVVSGYQILPVAWMAATGITTGVTSTLFKPDRAITRAELATMLWRYAGRPSTGFVSDKTCVTSGNSGVDGRQYQDYVTPQDIGSSVGPGVVGAMPTSSVGSMTINQDGYVLQDVVVDGCLTINGDNVTIRNVIINCDNTYPIKDNATTGTTVEYTRIDCHYNGSKGIYFQHSSDFTVLRIEITRCDDQFFIDGGLGNSRITHSVFHNQHPSSGAHTDGVQLAEFEYTDGTLTLDRNWWEYNRDGCCENAVLFATSGSSIDAIVTNNYMDGDFGTHLIRCHGGTKCVVQYNHVAYEPDGFVVYDRASRNGVARCNFYTSGPLIPNRLFDGITIDNSSC